MDPDANVVCIFRSTRTNHSDAEYAEWSERMDELVAAMPGYIDHLSHRNDVTGEGVTISYFQSMVALDTWREHAEHREAQALGRTDFYHEYEIEVAEIVRHYEWHA
jgi:heme-degrading monooxygenase HmoA